MARESYQDGLKQLKTGVLDMGKLVIDRLDMGIRALLENDAELAKSVIFGDDEINDMYLELEAECVNLLALQQPVAGDLRLIASSFKIITDLERIADLAVNLGDYTLDARREVFPDVDISSLGDLVLTMLTESIEAYEAQDADACFEISDKDVEVDALCKIANQVVVKTLIETQIESSTSFNILDDLMADVQRFLLTIRDIERIGDHAANIAARTLYMVTNNDELLY
jgi:phosphate transport system protein